MATRPKEPKSRGRPTSTHTEDDGRSVDSSNSKKKPQKSSQRADKIKDNSAHGTDESKRSQVKPPRKETGKETSTNREKNTEPSPRGNEEIFQRTASRRKEISRRGSAAPSEIKPARKLCRSMSLNLGNRDREVFQPSSNKLKDKPAQACYIKNKSEYNEHENGHCQEKTAAVKRVSGKVNEDKNDNMSKKDKEEHTVGDRKCVNSKAPKRLKDVVERLKLKMSDISNAATKVNKVVDTILRSDLIKRDPLFKDIERMASGSYYERVKISKPNEFDIMLKISIASYQTIELTNIDKSGAFYTLTFKQRKPQAMNEYLDTDGNILARQILIQFRKLVKDVILQTGMKVHLQKKDPSSPAVTLIIVNEPEVISVDLVLALKIPQLWPEKANNGMNIDSWLGTKVKQEYKRSHFYMVPKQAKLGKENKKDTWRISFSNIEKKILNRHGSGKTCCESNGEKCCRKQCLKLMKHLLELLNNNGNQRRMDQFCSYHAKTAILHLCTEWPKDEHWKLEDLDICFDRYVQYFQTCLKIFTLPNFFIPSHNLFSAEFVDRASCKYLNDELQNQNMFNYPIFYPEKGCPSVDLEE